MKIKYYSSNVILIYSPIHIQLAPRYLLHKGRKEMFSKPLRSKSPMRHAGQKRPTAPKTKVKTKSGGVPSKSARKIVPEAPVADEKGSLHSSAKRATRSQDSEFKQEAVATDDTSLPFVDIVFPSRSGQATKLIKVGGVLGVHAACI